LVEPLRALDKACYTDCAWQGEALGRLLIAPPDRAKVENKFVLPELYD
jgi:hypothetical protein